MILLGLTKEKILTKYSEEEYLKPCEQIRNLISIEYTPNPKQAIYPYDAGLNFCIIGDKLFFNPKTSNAAAVKIGCKHLIAVRQGYTTLKSGLKNIESRKKIPTQTAVKPVRRRARCP